eukprot:scaffold103266_cov66-Phaeocystis_antarctica.AAC.5
MAGRRRRRCRRRCRRRRVEHPCLLQGLSSEANQTYPEAHHRCAPSVQCQSAQPPGRSSSAEALGGADEGDDEVLLDRVSFLPRERTENELQLDAILRVSDDRLYVAIGVHLRVLLNPLPTKGCELLDLAGISYRRAHSELDADGFTRAARPIGDVVLHKVLVCDPGLLAFEVAKHDVCNRHGLHEAGQSYARVIRRRSARLVQRDDLTNVEGV